MDNIYFEEYENLEVHDLMLKDRPRQDAFRNAILNNAVLFKDKVVLDVGAGTGILSAFAAKAGAKIVFAVEASGLAEIATEIMEENNLSSVVKVIKSRVENLVLPAPHEKVDIIVSEWMGFYLLHEGMLDTIIYARNKFLKPDGKIFPHEATIYIAPCSIPERRDYYNYYDSVDGIKMKSFAKKLQTQKLSKPEIRILPPENLLSEQTAMYWMDLHTVTLDESSHIEFKHTAAVNKPGRFEGFCIWFDVRFSGSDPNHDEDLLTGPECPPTHWQQCVVALPEEACRDVEHQEPISYLITMKRNPLNTRQYNIEMELKDPDTESHPVPCPCYYTKCILLKSHLERHHNDVPMAGCGEG